MVGQAKLAKLIQHAGAGIKTKYRVKKGKAKITGVPVGKTKKAPGKLRSSLGLTNVGVSEQYLRKAQKHAQRESKYEQKLDIAQAEINKFTKAGTQYNTGAKQRAERALSDYKSKKANSITASISSGKTHKQALLDYKTGKKRLKTEIAQTKTKQATRTEALKYAQIASNMRTKYEAKLKQSKQKKRAYESAYTTRMARKAEKRKYFLVGKQAGKPIINELVGVKQRLGSIEVKLGDEQVPLNVLKPEDIIANPKLANDVLRQFPVLKQFATKKDPMFDFTKFDEKHKAELAGKILEHTRNPMPGMDNFPAILKDINETAFANYKDTQTPYGIHKALEAKRLAFEELRAKRRRETESQRQQALEHRLSINFTGQMPHGLVNMYPRSRIKTSRSGSQPNEEEIYGTEFEQRAEPEYESMQPFSKRDEETGSRNPLFANYNTISGQGDLSNLAGYGESPASTESLYSEADSHPGVRLATTGPEGVYSIHRGPGSGNTYNQLRSNISTMQAELATTTKPGARKALEQQIMTNTAKYAEALREAPRRDNYMDVAGNSLHRKTSNTNNNAPRKGDAESQYLEIKSTGSLNNEARNLEIGGEESPYMEVNGHNNKKGQYLEVGNKSANPAYSPVNRARGAPATDAGYINPEYAGRSTENTTYMDIAQAKTPNKELGEYVNLAGERQGRNAGAEYMQINSGPQTQTPASKSGTPMPTTPPPTPKSVNENIYLPIGNETNPETKNEDESDYMTVGEVGGKPAKDGGYINPNYAGRIMGNNTYMRVNGAQAPAPAPASKSGKPMPTTPAPTPKSVNKNMPETKRVDESSDYMTVGEAGGKPATDAGYIDPTNSGRQQNNTYMTVKEASRGTPANDAGYMKPNSAGRRNARRPGNSGDYLEINPPPASKLRKPMPTTPAQPPFSLAGKPTSKRGQNSSKLHDDGYLNINPARPDEATYADPERKGDARHANTGQYINVTGARKKNNKGEYMTLQEAREDPAYVSVAPRYQVPKGDARTANTGQYINVTGARKNNKGEYMTLQEVREDPAYVSVAPRYQVPKGSPVTPPPKNNSSPPLSPKKKKNGHKSQPNKKNNKNYKGKGPEYASLLPRSPEHNTYIEPIRQEADKVEYMTVKPAPSVSNANTKAGYMDPNKLRNTSKTGQYINASQLRSAGSTPNNAGYMSVQEMRSLQPKKRSKARNASNSGYLKVEP
jgi:hypothetical protein